MAKRKLSYTIRTYAPAYDTLEGVLQGMELHKACVVAEALPKKRAIDICRDEDMPSKTTQYKVTISIEAVPPRKIRSDKKSRRKY